MYGLATFAPVLENSIMDDLGLRTILDDNFDGIEPSEAVAASEIGWRILKLLRLTSSGTASPRG
jgi:hypothetical protein